MSMYRSYGVQPLGSTSTPPQSGQRPPQQSLYGYAASPPAPNGVAPSQTGFQQQSGSMQQPMVIGSSSTWNAPPAFGHGQTSGHAGSGTPQGPKQFSWGLPIANYTPKSAADDAAHGTPESPRAMHGTPSSTPNRPANPLYPSFDADDEAPPRESTMGLDDDDMVSSPPPPPVASTSQGSRSEQSKAEQPQQSCFKVIVFGFSSASQPVVLQAFKSLGEVVDIQHAPHSGANWCTLSYRKQWDASLATRKSGEVIGGTMIGVKWADGAPMDSYMPSTGTAAGAPDAFQQTMVPAHRAPPPLGERVNVLSANEALKRPSSTGSTTPGMLARLAGARSGNEQPGRGPSPSPHAALFKQPNTPNRGWSQTISNLVFGE